MKVNCDINKETKILYQYSEWGLKINQFWNSICQCQYQKLWPLIISCHVCQLFSVWSVSGSVASQTCFIVMKIFWNIGHYFVYIRSRHPWWGYSKGIIRLRIAAYDFLISRGSTQTNKVDPGWLMKYFWAEKYFNTAVFSNYDKISHPQSRPINHTLAMQ